MTDEPTGEELEQALRDAGCDEWEIYLMGPDIMRAVTPRKNCRLTNLEYPPVKSDD